VDAANDHSHQNSWNSWNGMSGGNVAPDKEWVPVVP